MKRALILAIAGLALVSCVSDSDPVPGARSRGTTAADIGALLGCSPVLKAEVVRDSFAIEKATCTVGDVSYRVVTFTDSDARDSWLQTAESFGGLRLVGDRWVIFGGSRAQLEQLKTTLGGEVR